METTQAEFNLLVAQGEIKSLRSALDRQRAECVGNMNLVRRLSMGDPLPVGVVYDISFAMLDRRLAEIAQLRAELDSSNRRCADLEKAKDYWGREYWNLRKEVAKRFED